MKTRNAFALKDFDSDRILQRPFFKKFREGYFVFEGLTDKEILEQLALQNSLALPDLQIRLDALDDLLNWTTKYQKHIKRHGERLTKYANFVANKLVTDENADIVSLRAEHKRTNDLLAKYCGFMSLSYGEVKITDVTSKAGYVEKLRKRIDEQYKTVDEEIKNFYRKIFADRLRFARQSQKLSQKAFAKKLGFSQNGYSPYESGQRDPSIPMLIRLSKMLGRSTDWLLGQTAW